MIAFLLVLGLCSQYGDAASVTPTNAIRRPERSINRQTLEVDQEPVSQSHEGFQFQLGIISDLDKRSKVTNHKGHDEWIAFLVTGNLTLKFKENNRKEMNVAIDWEENKPDVLKGSLSVGGRGMEMSELIVFQKKLYTCDDRSGIVYRLLPTFDDDQAPVHWEPVPWVILSSGDGNSTKGFKCEWATIKEGNLWIGSHGTSPELSYVKEITPLGEVRHHNWEERYRKMAATLGVKPPGYVVHEAVGWSDFHKKWVFIPRKISFESFDWEKDFYKASNRILLANEDFSDIQLHGVAGELMPSHGVSSFKWLPLANTNHSYIVALKAEEIGNDIQATYVLAFDMDGKILFPETKIEDNKYEGLEFL